VTSREGLEELRRNDAVVVTSQLDLQLRRGRLWWLSLALIPALMLGAATGAVQLLPGVLVSVALLLALGVVRPEESYRAVEWRVVIFLAAFFPAGDAMFRTGLADALASAVLAPLQGLPRELAPWLAVSLLYLVTSLVTETVTNNAAAVILTPVGIRMAGELGVDARPLLFAVCFGASASFLTPTGYQTNMMVYGPGNYRFFDFTRFGAPLNVALWLAASACIPLFWSFG
jgi:di/tricarboxylate transporter